MSTLLDNPVALTVLPPLVAGLCVGLLAWLTAGNRLASAVLIGLGVLFVYWLLEGFPPFPPAAAKQKLGHLFLGGAVLGLALAALPGITSRAILVLDLALIGGLVWMGWNKIAADAASAPVLVAVALAVLLAIGVMAGDSIAKAAPVEAQAELPFLVPGAWLVTAIAGAIVAASGLFLGMGQMLGALAALTGGVLLIAYLVLLTTGRGLDLAGRGGVLALGFAVSCALILTALLAPSASTAGLLILALGPLMPIAVLRWVSPALPAARFLRPILAGAVLALPAIAASLVAVFTGTSPFA